MPVRIFKARVVRTLFSRLSRGILGLRVPLLAGGGSIGGWVRSGGGSIGRDGVSLSREGVPSSGEDGVSMSEEEMGCRGS